MQCLKSTAEASYQQDIKEFLAKPIILTNGSFNGTITPISFNLMETLLLNDIWQRKLQGFLAIRATVVVRLQLNANKFQQGRLIMGYVPAGRDPYLRESKTCLSQLPHVELDIATETSAILEIPYVTPYTHFNLLNGTGESAYLLIREYISFKFGTGSSKCDYTIWCSLKDVELVTPASNSGFIAQSGRAPSKRPIRDAEVAPMANGPVSGVLSKIAKVASSLTDIPYISSYAGTVSWAAAIGSKVALAFGYSIPRAEKTADAVHRTLYAGDNNCDGIDPSDTLGLSVMNCVAPLPGLGGTDLDEMSLQFIQQISAFTSTFTWNTSTTADTVLYAVDLQPDNFYQTSLVPGCRDYTPVGFLAQAFRYYRGSLIIKLKIAKTSFHTGRMIVSFSPSTAIPIATPTNNQSAYLFREIIDLREATEYSFIIPYVSTDPYLLVSQPYGNFSVNVLNPLVAPDVVSSSIDFNVEVSCGKDMEWAYPKRIGWSPATFYAQSASVQDITDFVKQEKSLGTSAPTMNGDAQAASLCIGEKILSIKQLLNRWCPNILAVASGVNFADRPFDFFPTTIGSLGLVTTPVRNDYISIFGSMYRFNRGGVNVKYYSSSNAYGSVTLGYSNSASAAAPPYTAFASMVPLILDSPSIHKISVNVPMYHQWHTRTNSSRSSPTFRFVAPDTSPLVFCLETPSNDSFTRYGRYAADDYQLGFFLGIPPMYPLA